MSDSTLKTKNYIQNHEKIKDPVLILDDKSEYRTRIAKLCEELGFSTVTAENGAQGLEQVESRHFSIYIVDLLMPIVDGREFIRELKKRENDAVILVQSSINDPSEIIDVMKLGVFDYIIKPLDAVQFSQVLARAADYKYLKDQEKFLNQNAEKKLRTQLEWLVYKEKRRMEGSDSQEKNVIYNLKTNLSQGAGIGSMTTIIDLIKSTGKIEGESYKVPTKLMEMLFKNNEVAQITLKGLDQILRILSEELHFEKTKTDDFIKSVIEIMRNIEPYFKKKNIEFAYPEIMNSASVDVNIPIFKMILKELFINALKYSKNNSRVQIFTGISKGYFTIAIENEYIGNGVPREYEKMVMEPFFSLQTPLGEFSELEDFGLGLGLTVADHVIKKHNGLFFVHNVIDHVGRESRNCVLTEIFLPLVEKK